MVASSRVRLATKQDFNGHDTRLPRGMGWPIGPIALFFTETLESFLIAGRQMIRPVNVAPALIDAFCTLYGVTSQGNKYSIAANGHTALDH
jgi:hypothetical protein